MHNTLLPIENITPELLNEVAQTFIEEDADRIVPQWWNVMNEASKVACRQPNGEREAPHLSMLLLALELALDNCPLGQKEAAGAIGGIVIKSIVMGWRMAEMYLTRPVDGKEVQ